MNGRPITTIEEANKLLSVVTPEAANPSCMFASFLAPK